MDIRPILDPFLGLLKSRAFILMVVTALVTAVIAALPVLEPMRDELINVIVGLALALIGKMAIEDGAEKFGAARSQAQIEMALDAQFVDAGSALSPEVINAINKAVAEAVKAAG